MFTAPLSHDLPTRGLPPVTPQTQPPLIWCSYALKLLVKKTPDLVIYFLIEVPNFAQPNLLTSVPGLATQDHR